MREMILDNRLCIHDLLGRKLLLLMLLEQVNCLSRILILANLIRWLIGYYLALSLFLEIGVSLPFRNNALDFDIELDVPVVDIVLL